MNLNFNVALSYSKMINRDQDIVYVRLTFNVGSLPPRPILLMPLQNCTELTKLPVTFPRYDWATKWHSYCISNSLCHQLVLMAQRLARLD